MAQNSEDLGVSSSPTDLINPAAETPDQSQYYPDDMAVVGGDLQSDGKIPILVNDGKGNFIPTGKHLEIPDNGDLDVVTQELKDALVNNKDLEIKNKNLQKQVISLCLFVC